MRHISPIGRTPDLIPASPLKGKPKTQGNVSFKDMLGQFLGDVNALQKDAGQAVKKAVSGEITDLHQVMIAREKAATGLQLTVEVRNKLLEAYREIMRMQL